MEILYYCSMFASEAEFQSAFTGFLKRKGDLVGVAPLGGAIAFECKLLRCTQNPCSAAGCVSSVKVGAHEAMQATELLKASGKVAEACVHKISDESRGTKPFDCFYLSGESVRAYFVFATQHSIEGVSFWLVEPLTLAGAMHAGLRSVSLDWLRAHACGWGRL